jgi:hypothetical protein
MKKDKKIEQQLFDYGEELVLTHISLILRCIEAIKQGRVKDPDRLVEAIEEGYQIIKDYYRDILRIDLDNPPQRGEA